ncbi:zinc metalloprotease [Corynebacterium coyleae]
MGGETVDYNRYYFKDEIQAYKLLDNIEEFLGERDNIFRIGVIGDQIDQGNYASGISLVGDNSLFIANNRLMGSDAKLRNTILHELGHTLDLRHWGANDTVGDLIKGVSLPMAPEYDSVMNYLYQFGKFNYSEKPYLLETPNGNAVVPADWDVLKINTPRIAADNLEIGDFSAMAGAIIDNKPEAPAKEENKVEAPAADKADDKAEAPAQVEAEAEAPAKARNKANDKAEEQVQDQADAEQDAPAKVDNAKKQADNNKPAGADVNIAAIIAPIVALLAIVGIGIGFANMML